jgi:Flp pilus assembly pilin Flp
MRSKEKAMNRFITSLYVGGSIRAREAFRLVTTDRRGAGFFEYALIALIAVALMVVVYAGFKTQINNLFTKIGGNVSTNDSKLTP